MRKKLKISFLIAAHNEEKIIGKTIENLSKIPYNNYEVILGLDGCNDKTEEIVKKFCDKSGKIRYFKLDLRQGKAAVINSIIKKASGEIIIVNDADWIFKVKSKRAIEKFVSVFNDKKIGGIAESFPVEWETGKIKKGNLGYKMIAYSSYFWLKFQKERFTTKKDDLRLLKEPTMFLTNVSRKKLYKKNFSLGDDFERTYDIMDKKLEVVLFDDEDMPRMIAVYDKIALKDLFRQKIRTAVARKQIQRYKKLGFFSYYLPALFYMLKSSFQKRWGVGFLVFFWIILTSIATLFSLGKKADTKKGWMLRARR